jgi:hypothetical protein
MKTIITAVAATLFTAGISAADFYSGLDEGNMDLTGKSFGSEVTGAPPGVGDSFDRYHGLSEGNPDLFHPVGPVPTVRHSASGDDQPIYVGPGLTL